ncbi:vesicle-associated membrane protein 4 isoform X2 [Parus major]|uniref:vesicle-associated membrane protein 4 isoform X2 n=1 Tax=Parus major TaxID=9157 RepID=UPI0007714297|nr:vesicle-associated membrane protein 4 isoform X2 [Parus major]
MPPKFKRHLNDDEVTGSVKSERRNLLEEDSDEEEDFFLALALKHELIGVTFDKSETDPKTWEGLMGGGCLLDPDLDPGMTRSGNSLSDNAAAFSKRAKHLRRQMWWRDCKMKAIIAMVVVILLLVIIVPIVLKYRS